MSINPNTTDNSSIKNYLSHILIYNINSIEINLKKIKEECIQVLHYTFGSFFLFLQRNESVERKKKHGYFIYFLNR